MKAHYLLGIALAAATAVVACGAGPTDTLSPGGDEGDPSSSSSSSSGGTKKPSTSSSGGTTTPGTGSTEKPPEDQNLPTGTTNSPEGKAFFKANVFPVLNSKCGACHQAAGPGPAWMNADSEIAYSQLFKVGYVIQNSRIVQKGAHGGSTTNTLATTEANTYNQWVAMEIKDGGTKALPNVLEKLGGCFDKTKFDAMQMGNWATTTRNNNNNTNNVTPWNENQDNCTGCKNGTRCNTCHSSDPGSNFNDAVGNTLLPADTTFNNTKLTTPAYITKFFGVSPDGKPIASDGIKKKSDSTRKDKAYTHPMFTLNTQQQTALDAFVQDAITKYNAGTCTP